MTGSHPRPCRVPHCPCRRGAKFPRNMNRRALPAGMGGGRYSRNALRHAPTIVDPVAGMETNVRSEGHSGARFTMRRARALEQAATSRARHPSAWRRMGIPTKPTIPSRGSLASRRVAIRCESPTRKSSSLHLKVGSESGSEPLPRTARPLELDRARAAPPVHDDALDGSKPHPVAARLPCAANSELVKECSQILRRSSMFQAGARSAAQRGVERCRRGHSQPVERLGQGTRFDERDQGGCTLEDIGWCSLHFHRRARFVHGAPRRNGFVIAGVDALLQLALVTDTARSVCTSPPPKRSRSISRKPGSPPGRCFDHASHPTAIGSPIGRFIRWACFI